MNFDDGSGVEKVEFIDPLFQTPTLRHYKCKHPVTGRVDNEKVKLFDSATYSVIDKVTKQLRGNVVASFSLMSPTFNHFT